MFQKFQLIKIENRIVFQIPVLQVADNPQGYIFVLVPSSESIESFLTLFGLTC